MEGKTNKNIRWYAVQTYFGHENAVARDLRQRIESLNMSDKILEVLIPVENKVKIRAGKKIEKMESLYPGYIFVKMIVDDETWYIVQNTERVIGFAGTRSQPISLTEQEVEDMFSRMNERAGKIDTDVAEGEVVKIIDGPFADLEGKVDEVDAEKNQITILVPMFGKETPVKLDLFQIRKI